MALIEGAGLILRGKLGAVTCVYRKGTNFTRINNGRKDAKSPAQLAHRALYGQLQRLGALWNRDFIAPYYQGNTALESPYTRFIKYNWPRWDKTRPAWQAAIPFWDVTRRIDFTPVVPPPEAPPGETVKIAADIPEDAAAEGAEFYGYFSTAGPATFVKFTPQSAAAAGPALFDTGIASDGPLASIFFVCWLQRPASTMPLCMPQNKALKEG
jgi:hypothetical protein